MPTIEYWIQIENHAWDVSPRGVDRMTGQTFAAMLPPAGRTPNRAMYKALDNEALILRRYTPGWAAPDDRKVNPWDLNELNPATTMGTIPGPTIECDLATSDDVLVHFRNMDMRRNANGQLLPAEKRAHSLHPHGFVFAPQFDGAYPLTPPDTAQPVPPAEVAAWLSLGVTGSKQGDRVPAPTTAAGTAGSFTYRWQTIGWPTTAGVWLYHDHSICDMDNVNSGAIGIIVIHNSNDPEDIITQDLPDGDANGSPIEVICFPPPFEIPLLANAISLIGQVGTGLVAGGGMTAAGGAMPGMAGMGGGTPVTESTAAVRGAPKKGAAAPRQSHGEGTATTGVVKDLSELIDLDNLLFDVDLKALRIRRFCIRRYLAPKQAIYLQLYHTLGDAGVCVNGRKFLGNTPTMVAGEDTRMRFGVVGMGNDFHTFHIHGHRWILPGPHGTDLGTIQGSRQDQAISQFEDTRIFGPANSFVFTIHEGDGFMRPPPGMAVGEWHMHCHVLMHMDMGMMGSLLVVKPGTFPFPLPRGVPCPPDTPAPPPGIHEVRMAGAQFSPKSLSIPRGDVVRFINDDSLQHSATSDDGGATFDCCPMCTFANLGACLAPGNVGPASRFDWQSPAVGSFPMTVGYHCRLHGAAGGGMFGTITVT